MRINMLLFDFQALTAHRSRTNPFVWNVLGKHRFSKFDKNFNTHQFCFCKINNLIQ